MQNMMLHVYSLTIEHTWCFNTTAPPMLSWREILGGDLFLDEVPPLDQFAVADEAAHSLVLSMHRDHPCARELDDAVGAAEVDEALQLGGHPAQLDHQLLRRDIHHLRRPRLRVRGEEWARQGLWLAGGVCAALPSKSVVSSKMALRSAGCGVATLIIMKSRST